jgi:putative transposase
VKREAIAHLVAEHDLSIRRACAVVKLSRAAYYRTNRSAQGRDDMVIEGLNQVVAACPRWGFWKCFDRLRLDGKPWNHKRVWRVYREMRLNLPRRTKKRLPQRERQTLDVPEAPNVIWAFDFMSDALYQGRRFRTLNVIDEGVREALDIVIDTSIPAGRVVRTFEQLSRWRGLPQAIRCDNGPEMLSQAFVDWCNENQVEIRYIQPGKPNQNAFIERFNRTYRNEVLDAHLFESLSQVRELTYRWLQTYNEIRPHDALGRIPPAVFRRRLEEARISTFELST